MMKVPLAPLTLTLTLAACGSSNPAVNALDGASQDLRADLSAADLSAPDVTPPTDARADATSPDLPASVDAPVGDGAPGACRAQSDCADNEVGRRVCDTATGQCVPCAAGLRGSCAAGEYCTTANRCEAGCGADLDCAGDGGLARLVPQCK